MNTYLETVWLQSLKNPSAEEYISLCSAALERNDVDGYIEKHHILPKCICNVSLEIKDKQNLVILTAKEHFIAHTLLTKMFEGKTARKMMYALSALSFKRNGDRILDAEDFAVTKEASRLAKKGIPLSEDHKQKIRDKFAEHNPNKGRVVSQETKDKQRLAKAGIPRSQAAKDAISKTTKGVSKEKQPLMSCIICRKAGGFRAIKQHHFNKCKQGA
jgi:hypothetical protein